MYAAYFGLVEPPFSITPDPRYLYMSEAHREALAHLLYGLGTGGGFVQLTGEVGTGKTTLCRCLLEQLPPRVDVAFVLNPKVSDVELLAAICDELRIPYPPGTTSRKLFVDALHHHVLEAHARGHRTVLIIDEAQDLAPDVLEQIRLLTNLETTTEKLLQIILIGQPELIHLLERDDLRQLAQRVTARYHLQPVGQADTRAYILHRLAVAGQKEPIFTEPAMRQVHRAARGVPRLINVVCDRALLGAYTEDQRRVSAAVVKRAAREVLGPARRRRAGAWPGWAPAAAAAALVLIGGGVLLGRHAAGLPWIAGVQGGSSGPATPSMARPLPGSVALVEDTASLPPASPPAVAVAEARESRRGAGTVSLASLLSDPSVDADKKSAFTSLYGSWRIQFDGTRSALGCERGRAEGLQCLFKTGTWAKLRRYDLPAIIELSAPSGERRYGTVLALGDDSATLDLGGRPYAFPLREIDRYWEGAFIMLWEAPALVSSSISPGARSKDVEWVRQRLGELDGTPPPGRNRDVFDDELRARVLAFQRARALVADGIVGEETLIHLSTAQRDARAPRLLRTGS
jgi:general secretion pathway protein A